MLNLDSKGMLAKNANWILDLVLSESNSNAKDRLNLNQFLDTDSSTNNKVWALNLNQDIEAPPKKELRLTWSAPKSA